jgi:hypothetical protein
VIRVVGAALLMLLAMGNGDEQARPPQPPPVQGFIFHQQVIIRVTPVPRPGANRVVSGSQNITWHESGGPRCVPIRAILGAAQISQDGIDLVLRDATRIRARLERHCPAMDYYFGVYVRPNPDGMLCADRDAFRARSGGTCEIERFRLLRPREP